MKKTLLFLFFTAISFAQTNVLTPVDRLRIKTPNELSGNTQVITRGTATGETGFVLKSDLTDVLKYATASAFPLTGVVGKLYYAIDTDLYYKWDGATYEEFGAGGTETDPLALKIANNLSDLASASTARTNLGLGTLATQNAESYTTQSGDAYTFVLGDANTQISFTSTNTTPTILTMPTNASVAFPIGTKIKLFRTTTTSFMTLSGSGVDFISYLGTAVSSINLPRGISVITKVATNRWQVEYAPDWRFNGSSWQLSDTINTFNVAILSTSGSVLTPLVGGVTDTQFTFGDTASFNRIGGYANTTGNKNALSSTITFNPTSGTGTFNAFNFSPIINQTGGANGITRALYINPTLTSAFDFRAIDVVSGKVMFPATMPTGSGTEKMLVKDSSTGQVKELDIPSGSGSTNLSTTYAPTTVTIVSSSGTDATVNAVDGTNAGVVTPTQKSTWDGKQDALGFTPYNATNPSGYQTASQVQTIADAKVSNQPYDYLDWNGVLDIAPTKNAVAQELSYIDQTKQPLSSVLTATTASFTTADETKLDKYPSTATNGKILQGNGTNYVEVDAPTSPTTIVGITGTKAQYDTSVTDGNFMYVGDAPTAHTHTSSEVTDFNSATRAQTEAELVAGTNITITPSGTGATRQLTIASTGGSTSGSGTYSETPTWSNTAPTTLLANNFEWIEQNKVVNLRISLSYNVAASNTSVRLPLPSGSPVPKSITGFTGASNIQTFGSGLMFIDIDALPASAGRSCFLRRNPANNGYEVVVQHSAAISLKNVIANITYISE